MTMAFLQGHAGVVHPLLVEENILALGIGDPHNLGNGLGQQAEFPFRDVLRQDIPGGEGCCRRRGRKRECLALRRLEHGPIVVLRICEFRQGQSQSGARQMMVLMHEGNQPAHDGKHRHHRHLRPGGDRQGVDRVHEKIVGQPDGKQGGRQTAPEAAKMGAEENGRVEEKPEERLHHGPEQ